MAIPFPYLENHGDCNGLFEVLHLEFGNSCMLYISDSMCKVIVGIISICEHKTAESTNSKLQTTGYVP